MLKGKRELLRRLEAIKPVAKPISVKWAKSATASARRRVPVKTGRLRNSIRTKTTSPRGAIVVGHFSANFVDAGTRAHREKPRARRGKRALKYGGRDGLPMFAKRVNHPSTRARPFKAAAARDGLRENPMAATLVKLWNDAA